MSPAAPGKTHRGRVAAALAASCALIAAGLLLAPAAHAAPVGFLPAGQTVVATVHAHINAAAVAGSYDLLRSGTVGSSSRKDFTPDITFTVPAPTPPTSPSR